MFLTLQRYDRINRKLRPERIANSSCVRPASFLYYFYLDSFSGFDTVFLNFSNHLSADYFGKLQA